MIASNFMKLRNIYLLVLAALAGLTNLSLADTVTYTDGDLFIGFRATGGSQDYLVDIGQPDQFLNASSAFTVNVGNIASDLVAVFGSNWYTRTDLFYSVIGGNQFGLGSDPSNTLYATKAAATPTWTRKSDGSQSSTTTLIAAMGNFYDGLDSTSNNPHGLIQTASANNSYASYQPGGTIANSGGISFNNFNPNNEGLPNQTLYLNRLTSTANSAGQVLLGTISISDQGVVTFTPSGTAFVHFEHATYSIAEDGGQVSINVIREGDMTGAFTVNFSTQDDSAHDGTDYTAKSTTLSFAANETSKPVTVSITNVSGIDRDFKVNLTNPSTGAATNAPSTATVNIAGTAAGTLAFAQATAQFEPLNGQGNPNSFSLTVNRTQGSHGAVSATVGVTGGTLTSPDNFTFTTPVSFADGVTTATVDVTLKDLSAGNLVPGTFTLTLSNPTGNATIGSQASTTVTITSPGTVAFSSSTYEGTESSSQDVPVTITVNRTGGANGAIDVEVAATGSAQSGTDYTLPASPVPLHWDDGDSAAKTFDVTLKANATANATVILTLQNAQGGVTIGTPNPATLTIKAPDTANPTVTLVSPKANGKFSGGSVTFAGEAKDDIGVDRVEITFNGGAPHVLHPQSATADFNYSADLTPEQGVNTVTVTAFDTHNNASSQVTRTITFTNVRPNLAGKYNGLLTAATDPNTYDGLVAIAVTPTGTFTGKVTLSGVALPITGTFQTGGDAKFGKTNTATTELVKKDKSGTTSLGQLALTIDTAGGHKITGTIQKNAVTQATIPHADQALYTSKKNPVAPFLNVPTTILNPAREKGKYTAVFEAGTAPNNGLAASAYPQGDGFATLTVSSSGIVKIVGKLADGSTVSYANAVSSDSNHNWPVFILLYSKQGFMTGNVTFTPTAQTDASCAGMLWVKSANLAKQTFYPGGWPNGIGIDFVASAYLAPTKPTTKVPNPPNPNTVLTIAAGTDNLTIALGDGALTTNTSNEASLDAKSKVTIIGPTNGQTGATALKVAFSTSTGLLSGSFTHPVSNKKVSFQGIAYQKSKVAFGYFLFTPAKNAGGTAQSGDVSITTH